MGPFGSLDCTDFNFPFRQEHLSDCRRREAAASWGTTTAGVSHLADEWALQRSSHHPLWLPCVSWRNSKNASPTSCHCCSRHFAVCFIFLFPVLLFTPRPQPAGSYQRGQRSNYLDTIREPKGLNDKKRKLAEYQEELGRTKRLRNSKTFHSLFHRHSEPIQNQQ